MATLLTGLKSKLTYIDILFSTLMVFGVVLIIYGGVSVIRKPAVEVEYLSGGRDAVSQRLIWVEVTGAVVSPGVYQMEEGARIKDALAQASGLSQMADRDYVARTLNLVDKLKDGQKIYIPEVVIETNPSVGGTPVSRPASMTLVNINTASRSQLDSLWGIGDTRAGAIIDGRPYGAVDELVSRGIVPRNVYDKNKDKLSVY